MPRVIFVKKAQKPNSVVSQEDIDRANAGETGAASYFWAAFKTGPRSSMKKFWKKQPPQSELTLSEFWSTVYGIQEDAESDSFDFDDLESKRDEYAERIREVGEECRGKFDNMPEGLQQGDSGQLLEQRADSCEQVADDIEGIDIPCEDDYSEEEPEDKESEAWEEWNEAREEWKEEEADRVRSEIVDYLSNVEG